MKKFIFKHVFFLITIFFLNNLLASEIKVIELHNKSIDQILLEENNLNNQNTSENNDLSLDNNETINDENIEDDSSLIQPSESTVEIEELFDAWEKFNKDELNFLLQNINNIKSSILKKEMVSILNEPNKVPEGFTKNEFDKILIDSLLKLGERKKTFQKIQSLGVFEESNIKNFYEEFTINYLLSTYSLSEACDYRRDIKDFSLSEDKNFFLKIDIFCLLLEEKFDEANLLYSLLLESEQIKDLYFEKLFNKLQNIDNNISVSKNDIADEKYIFLYSAMHRIGNLPLTEKFLEIDPINLSLPIILSYSTEIDLRLKSAHFAFFNNLINVDSLAALYQTVDFTYDELNNPSKVISSLDGNIEIGMAYYYQLINIQLLPTTRLNAIMNFWEFAEKNNLEKIAYELSLKSLNTIEPSSELSIFGPQIVKAYILGKDYKNAEKWLLHSESSNLDADAVYRLNSSRLLFNLYNIKEEENLTNVLFDNLKYMNTQLIDDNNLNNEDKNEILNLIFSSLNNDIENPFKIKEKIFEEKSMPSLYLINMIRQARENNNSLKLFLSIILSIDGKKWNDIHPEHLRLILLSLKEYKNGFILNDILLELLHENKII